jgi:cobalt/nickel transport system permease protein
MANRIPSFLLAQSTPVSLKQGTGKVRVPFLERGIDHLAGVIKNGYAQWEVSSQNGFFQKIDARIKVLFLLFLIIIISLKRDFLSEIYIWVFLLMLVLLSRLSIVTFCKRVLFLGFIFGFLIALPSAFSMITKGEMILPIVKLSRPYHFWIYYIPADLGITREGILGVTTLTMRVVNSLSLSFLILYTTPFQEIIKALKVLKVPDSFIIIITLCYKYIFIFSKTVEDMHLAKKSRMIREDSHAEAREWIAGRLVFIFRKTRLRCEELFKAMIGRGFSGPIRLHGFRKMHTADWFSGIFFFAMGLLFLVI